MYKKTNKVILAMTIAIISFSMITPAISGTFNRPSDEAISAYIKENPGLIKDVVIENPDIVLDVIKANTPAVLKAINDTLEIQAAAQKKQMIEDSFKNLKHPSIADTRPLKPGSVKDAIIEIIVFSSFQCGYCKTGATVIDELTAQYPGQTKVVFKHSTHSQLDFKQALIFETLGQKDVELAWKMHDFMFENMEEIRENPKILDDKLVSFGIDIKSFYNDLSSKVVTDHIKDDNKEIREFDIKGTPNFIINGVQIKGAIPLEEMIQIVEKTLARS